MSTGPVLPDARNGNCSVLADILSRKHWVFDLDGTLTLAVHDFQAIKLALDIPLDADILGHLDALPREAAAPLHRKLDDIERELCLQASAAEGAQELLSFLVDNGCRLGILTRNTREVAILTLQHAGLGQFFHEPAWVLGRHDAAPKPDPEGILQLAALWDVSPDTMVMVGDYLYDLLCGRNVGAATIHVDPAARFRWSDLADLEVATLRDLVDISGRLS